MLLVFALGVQLVAIEVTGNECCQVYHLRLSRYIKHLEVSCELVQVLRA